jgi:hypothetical protein
VHFRGWSIGGIPSSAQCLHEIRCVRKGYSCLKLACTRRTSPSSFTEVLGPFMIKRTRTSQVKWCQCQACLQNVGSRTPLKCPNSHRALEIEIQTHSWTMKTTSIFLRGMWTFLGENLAGNHKLMQRIVGVSLRSRLLIYLAQKTICYSIAGGKRHRGGLFLICEVLTFYPGWTFASAFLQIVFSMESQAGVAHCEECLLVCRSFNFTWLISSHFF